MNLILTVSEIPTRESPNQIGVTLRWTPSLNPLKAETQLTLTLNTQDPQKHKTFISEPILSSLTPLEFDLSRLARSFRLRPFYKRSLVQFLNSVSLHRNREKQTPLRYLLIPSTPLPPENVWTLNHFINVPYTKESVKALQDALTHLSQQTPSGHNTHYSITYPYHKHLVKALTSFISKPTGKEQAQPSRPGVWSGLTPKESRPYLNELNKAPLPQKQTQDPWKNAWLRP